MVVALGAAHGRAQPDAGEAADAVGGGLGLVLFRLRAALFGRLVELVVAGGDFLPERGVGQEISGELLDRELVELLVLVERLDDVVAIGVDHARVVAVVAAGVGEADEVKPEERHPLAVVGRGEEAVDLLLEGVLRRVGEEGVYFRERRRKADEVEAEPTEERDLVRLGRGREALLLEPREQKGVDRIPRPCPVLDGRRGRLPGRDEGPVALVLGALLDPLAEERDLGRGELLARFGGRHLFLGVLRGDAMPKLALVGLSGDDGGLPLFDLGERALFRVEPEVGLPRLCIGTVAFVAVFGEDRADVAVELDLVGHRVGDLRCLLPLCGQEERGDKEAKKQPMHEAYPPVDQGHHPR